MAAGLILLTDRGGLIAWSTCFAGIALLAKISLKPSGRDLKLSIGLAAVPLLAWAATLSYVISTWESGEVVELVIDTDRGAHTVRVWVLDIGADPLVYYDAEPGAAMSLLAGEPLRLTRAEDVSVRIPIATRVEALDQEQTKRIFEAMGAKYGDRMGAADVYYLMLGRSRDRIAVVASLIEEQADCSPCCSIM